MTSSETLKPDPNKQFFDTTYEIGQLQMGIAENALGMDVLWASADEQAKIMGTAAQVELSDEELAELMTQETAPFDIDNLMKVSTAFECAGEMIDQRVGKLKGLTLLYIGTGELLFSKDEWPDNDKRLHKVLSIRGDGQMTKMEQTLRLAPPNEPYIEGQLEPVPPDVTLDEVNSYLANYLAAAHEVLACPPEEIRAMIAQRTES